MENSRFYDKATRPAPESYGVQASTLLEMQRDNAKELYAYGITGRAYATLHKNTREIIDNASPMLIQTAVYQRLHPGQTSDPGSAEFGVRFSVTEYRSKSAQDTRHFDVPIGQFRNGTATPLQDLEDLQSISDTNRVYFLVYGLRRAKDNGALHDLSADLTKIHDFENSLSSVPPQKQ